MKQNLYTCNAVSNLIDRYTEAGGEVITISEGVLGYGTMILQGEGLKSAVIQEIALNEWSSAHKIRMYNELPQKWIKAIEEAEEREIREEVTA